MSTEENKVDSTPTRGSAIRGKLLPFFGGAVILPTIVAFGGVFDIQFILDKHPHAKLDPTPDAEASIHSTIDVFSLLKEGPDEAQDIEYKSVCTDFSLEPKTVNYKIKSGDTVAGIWSDFGAPSRGAALAAEALKRAGVGPSNFRPGDELELTIAFDGDIIGIKKRMLGQSKVVSFRGSSEQGFSSSAMLIETFEEQKVVSGTITDSLAGAAQDAELPFSVLDEVVDLFSDRVAFERDIHEGDTFTIVYSERRTADGELLAPGPVKAASIYNRGKMLAVIRHTGTDGKSGYFDEQGKAIGDSFLRYPLQFTRISSLFSRSRFHPILKIHRPHNGVDFAAPIGTPVRTVADGTVVVAGVRGGAGRMVEIRHNEKYSTTYLHLSRISSGIVSGSRVRRGQVIGAVGMTGYATAPHLHFGFYDRGRYVDPLRVHLPVLMQTTTPIPVQALAEALQLLKRERESVMIAAAEAAKSPNV